MALRSEDRHDPLGAEIRSIAQQANKDGWTVSRIASGMRERGHSTWNESVVRRLLESGRGIYIDEAVDLLAMLKGSSQLLITRIDSVTAKVAAAGRRRP